MPSRDDRRHMAPTPDQQTDSPDRIAGDEAHKLVDQYFSDQLNDLRGFALGICRGVSDDADECVQRAFESIHTAIRRGGTLEAELLTSYVKVALVSQYKQLVRARNGKRQYSLEALAALDAVGPAADCG